MSPCIEDPLRVANKPKQKLYSAHVAFDLFRCSLFVSPARGFDCFSNSLSSLITKHGSASSLQCIAEAHVNSLLVRKKSHIPSISLLNLTLHLLVRFRMQSRMNTSSTSQQTSIYSALQLVLSEADHATLQRVITSACRAVYFVPAALTPLQSSLTKLALFNALRSAGASVSDEQLETILQTVLEYNELSQNDTHSALTHTTLSTEHFDTLSRWNAQTASSFDQVLLTSRAGTRHIENLPSSERADLSSTTPPSPSSSPEVSFSSSWLRLRCSTTPTVKSRNLTPSEMALSVHSLLMDRTLSNEAIQEHLFDAFAGDFDAVSDVLSKRELIQKNSDAILADCHHATYLEQLDLNSASSRHRGVSGRRVEPSGLGRLSAQVSVRDRAQEAVQRDLERESRRLAKATLLPSRQEQDAELLQPSLGGSSFEERQKAFPDVQLDGDSSIGAIDRVGLPRGFTREVGKGYEEIFVPAPLQSPVSGNLVQISSAFAEHPELLQAMAGVSRLNRLQSTVYPVAFHSDENLLVCAPTGAGKTNVALLTILREIVAVKKREQRSFKVVYVAPMKALASEVTEKFGRRLLALGLCVREFTGDMSLSRSEAMETHVLVTTPEKWDVVTRKSGSDLGDSVTLFIIDEIHLLHDDRGSVLESIVARTLRLSETAQRRIRLVGLSATLPNYADVGEFMRVDPHKGLFHFDASYRPVPLSQTFIGISEGENSNSNEARRRRQNKVHEMAWRKVKSSLQRGHQAMIFVHSRKGTSSAAREMLVRAAQDGCESLFVGAEKTSSSLVKTASSRGENPDSKDSHTAILPSWATKEISKSKTADIRELCNRGVGIHNAGLPRSDRNLVEKLFSEGVIRLLCCTATLAWGINLPARTVVIMGTEVYSAEKGGFVQLGMLDVMQIFGRAGRPQFDTEGEGTIITMHEYLGKYLNMLTSSIPIESQLSASASRLADHLNAEVVSGTVSSIGEGVKWLSYTYLSVRMPKNPLAYGIDWAEIEADASLHSRRATLIDQAARALDDAHMCRYDPRTGALAPTDLGRVSSHFYVSHETVVMWNEMFSDSAWEAVVTDEDWDGTYATVIHAISCATEFEQMRSRQEEAQELERLTRDACPLPLKAGSETREGKVAILLQAHISRAHIRMSDLSYVVESATRLLRALFEISLRKGLPGLSLAALEIARASESRIWPFQHPLWQFTNISRRGGGLVIQPETIAMIESFPEDNSISSLRAKAKEELSAITRAPKVVSSVQRVLKSIPSLEIDKALVAPLNRSVLSIHVSLFPNFRWNDVLHGKTESWWLWVEDLEENRVYHSERIVLTKRQVQSLTADWFAHNEPRKRTLNYEFTVPVFDPPSSQYWVRVESDRWHTGRESRAPLSLVKMDLPVEKSYKSTLLDLRPLPVEAALREREVEIFEKEMTHFTPVQTQAFHVAYHSNENMLLSAPFGSGMESVVQIAILSALTRLPSAVVVYLGSDIRALELQRKRWAPMESVTKGSVSLVADENVFLQPSDVSCRSIILTTPQRWYYFSRTWDDSEICKYVSLFVFDELHLLLEQHHTTELLLTRLRRIADYHTSRDVNKEITRAPRVVALSVLVPNAAQVGKWLGVSSEKGLFCFGPENREVPSELQVVGVAGDRHASRMYSLSRPLFAVIQRYSAKKPALIFVSSRRQALLTAQDLVRMASLNGRAHFRGDPSKSKASIDRVLRRIRDISLQRSLGKGIALYHERMSIVERDAVEDLYKYGYAQVMICTFGMSRALEVRSHQVIVKGTERFDNCTCRFEDIPVADILHMVGKAGRPRKDSTGYATVFVHEPKKALVKKILHEPLPVESRMLSFGLPMVLNDLISLSGRCRVLDILDWLSSTLLFQRLGSNPGYYGMMKRCNPEDRQTAVSNGGEKEWNGIDSKREFCEREVLEAIRTLEQASCVVTRENQKTGSSQVISSSVGHISAAYGVNPQSAKHIASRIAECQSFQVTVHVISGCDEVAIVERQVTEEKLWKYMFDVVTEEFCANKVFSSTEAAAMALGVNGWLESPLKRTRLLCFSLLVDTRQRSDTSMSFRGLLFRNFSRLLNVGFEIAAETGSVSALRSFVVISQSLYQGVPPYSDVWTLCGSENKELNAKGRQEGWTTITKVQQKLEDFNVFLVRTCKEENERTAFWRRIQNYPKLEIAEGKESERDGEVCIDITVKRTGSKHIAEDKSRVSRKREGGYVLIASSEKTGDVLCVQRFTECGARKSGGNECTVRLKVLMPTSEDEKHGADVGDIRIWVASDVLLGIEAEVVLFHCGEQEA